MAIQDCNVDSLSRVSTETLVFFVPGAITANAAGVLRIRLPYGARIRRSFVNAQTVSGTAPTLSVTWKDGTSNTALFTSSNVTAANTPAFNAVDVPFAANHDLAADFTVGGTTPSFGNVTVQLTIEKCDQRDIGVLSSGGVTW